MEYPKGHWYPILEAKDLKQKPVKIKRFGENLVLWRKKNGEIACLKDRCPHRSTSLSLGRIVNDNIECPMHGFQYGSSGECHLIPANGKNSPIPPSFCTTSFTVREAHQALWLWWGDAKDVLPEIPWPKELESAYKHWNSGSMYCSINFYRMMEANLDVLHFPFTHRPSKLVQYLATNFKAFKFYDFGTRIEPFHCNVKNSEHGKMIELIWDFCHEEEGGLRYTSPIPATLWVYFPHQLVVDAALFKTRGYFGCSPIDDQNAWFYMRFYQGFCPLPLLGNFFAWLYVKWVLGPITTQDLRLQKTQTQGLGLGQDRLVARADRGVMEYWRLVQESLRQESSEESVKEFSKPNELSH